MEKTRIGIRIGTRIEELETSANTPSFKLVRLELSVNGNGKKLLFHPLTFRGKGRESETERVHYCWALKTDPEEASMKRILVASIMVSMVAASVSMAGTKILEDRGALLLGGRAPITGLRAGAYNFGARLYSGDDVTGLGAYGSYKLNNGFALGLNYTQLDDDEQFGLGKGNAFGGSVAYDLYQKSYYSLSTYADLSRAGYDDGSAIGLGAGMTFGIGWDTDDACDCPWCWLWYDYDPMCGCYMCRFVEDYYFYGSAGVLYQKFSPDWSGASDKSYVDPVVSVGARMTLKYNLFLGAELSWADKSNFQIYAGYRIQPQGD